MKIRYSLVTLFMVVLAGIGVACGGAAPPEQPAAAADTTVSGDAAAESGSLIIYSGRSESLIGPLIAQFEAATDIKVDVRYGSTSEMAGVLLEEGDRSPADIFYAQDPGGLAAVQKAGLFQTLPDSILDAVPERFRATDGTWVGVSGRARVIVYNTDVITDPAGQLPADIYDFIDPQWDGRLGWAPTNASFQAMVTAMRHVWGEEKTRTWLEGIQANHPLIFESNTPIVEAVGAGEIDAGFVNHYYLYRFLAEQGESFAARNYFLPGGGPGSLVMVSGAGILGSAKNSENAQRFFEYLLSETGQHYFAEQSFEYPISHAGASLPVDLPPIADLEASAAHIPMSDLGDLQGTQDLLIELGIID
ncbi:MAG: iron ABC transporter substrate-binding protein [Candidatus Promineofilum sp.]|nr:iron ABC transporter substrate-binding protein [Promineifilum sp.]